MRKVYSSTYTFKPTKNTTIKAIVYKTNNFNNIKWPVEGGIDAFGNNSYEFKSPLKLLIPKGSNYVQIYFDSIIPNTVIKSSTGVVWFDNTNDSSIRSSIIHVTSYIESNSDTETDNDNTTVEYTLYLVTSSEVAPNSKLYVQYGQSINNIGLNAENVIEDTLD